MRPVKKPAPPRNTPSWIEWWLILLILIPLTLCVIKFGVWLF